MALTSDDNQITDWNGSQKKKKNETKIAYTKSEDTVQINNQFD